MEKLGGTGVLLCPAPVVPLSCRGEDGMDADRDDAGSSPHHLMSIASSFSTSQTNFSHQLPFCLPGSRACRKDGVWVGYMGGDLG